MSDGFARDKKTGALLNIESRDYQMHLARRVELREKKELIARVEELEARVKRLESINNV